MNLTCLRHVAKEILAAATIELFPKVQLIGGYVDSMGFYYDFVFSKEILTIFSERELLHIEDRMIQIIHYDIPIKELEMMRENASTYLRHLGHLERSENAACYPTNILSMIEFGSFKDICPPPYLATTGEVKAFKLQKFIIDGRKIRIIGTAFYDKKDLKQYLKQYKEASKRDPVKIGPKEGYFIPFKHEWIYLEKGKKLLDQLKKYWDQEHKDFECVVFPETLNARDVHEAIFAEKKIKYLKSFSPTKGDLISIKCNDEKELFEKLISSLHFIEKAFKIFPFELRMYCVESGSSRLLSALKQAGCIYREEPPNGAPSHIAFRVADGYGQERIFSYLTVERKTHVLHRSLFYSPKWWVAQMIQMGVEI